MSISRTSFRVLSLPAIVATLFAALLVSSGAQAQAVERVVAYEIDVTIEESGDLLVSERIVYDFGPRSDAHGILRDIVTRQGYDDEHDRLLPLDEIVVRSDSAATPTDLSVESPGGGLTRLRIGDADIEISGQHTYLITYRQSGVLNAFEDHDELFWNAIGSGWDVPIEQATVVVHAPAEFLDATCFGGPAGSQLECDALSVDGDVVTFEQSQLWPGDALTVVASLPKGAVTEPVPVLDQLWSFQRAFTIDALRVAAAIAVALVSIGGIAWLAWRTGRDRRWLMQPVAAVPAGHDDIEVPVPLGGAGAYPVEYMPPEGLRPGLVGTLFDETAHPLDVTATIVDLAVRGYLRIEEIEGKGLFGKDDWRLKRLKPSDGLEVYEKLLLDSLFEDGDETLLSDLRGDFAPRMGKVQEALYADILHRGWYRRSPSSTRGTWLAIGIVALVAAVGLVVLVAVFTSYAIVPLGLVPAAVVLIAVHQKMPARTARGTAMYRRVLGFRRFILDAETHRARFAEEAGLFYEYLPYAIVFGATKQWAKAFEGLAVPAPDWYTSNQVFTSLLLVNAMDSFSDRTVGSLTYTPGSSGGSGFGGGGFSGGGVGGGGGGSW